MLHIRRYSQDSKNNRVITSKEISQIKEKDKLFTIDEVAEHMAKAFLAQLYTWDNAKSLLGTLQYCFPEIVIHTRDGFMLNPKAVLKLKIDLKDHFKDLNEFSSEVYSSLVPFILQGLQEDLNTVQELQKGIIDERTSVV